MIQKGKDLTNSYPFKFITSFVVNCPLQCTMYTEQLSIDNDLVPSVLYVHNNHTEHCKF